MAKIRRVIRKVPTAGTGDFFDDKTWPVNIALIVLGGFLMGVSAAYQPFFGVAWHRSAFLPLVLIPLIIGGCMLAFRFIDSQWLRRSMQLSLVIAAIVHVLLIVQLKETILAAFAPRDEVVEQEVIESRTANRRIEYMPIQLTQEEDRPKQDFEKPVETETPQPRPEPEMIVRQEIKPDPPRTVKQPIPVPEPVATTEPSVMQRPEPNETPPKQADQTSTLSRQPRPAEMKTSHLADLPPVEQPKAASAEAKPKSAMPEKQVAESASTRTTETKEPSANTAAPTAQVAKKTEQSAPQTESTAAPTLKRQTGLPAATPRAQIAALDTPPKPKETNPSELAPANTQTSKRITASPEVAAKTAEPTLDASAQPAAAPQRRQQQAETQPTLAQSPAPAPTQQARVTARPDAVTSSPVKSPSAPSATTARPAVDPTPQSSRVERATAQVTSAKMVESSSAAPITPTTTAVSSQVARAKTPENPTAQANPQARPTLTRATGAPSLPNATKIEPAVAAASTSPAASELSPASTATRKQAATSPQVATAMGESRAEQAAMVENAAPSATPLHRAANTQNTGASPQLADAANVSPAAARSVKSAVANSATSVSEVPTNVGPQVAANAAPGPSSTAVSRQTAANSAAASRTQPTADAATSPTTAGVVGGGAARAQVSATPTLDPSASPGAAPRRATAVAASAASPSSADSPATALAASNSSSPTAEPSRLAVTKGQGGSAGVGSSPNLDNAAPHGDSPAQVASSAARRAQATQQAPAGDAFSPSAPAALARSQAGAAAPTSTTKADATELAANPGGNRVAEVSASSSAALTRADASVELSNTTAAKGMGEVDLGPTQLVADPGSGRAAGGGQPQISLDNQAARAVARANSGGAPLMSLAGATVAEVVAAPAGDGGGQPAASPLEANKVAAARTLAGGAAPIAGGPSVAMEKGPLAEATSAAVLAKSDLSRADSASGGAGGAAGQPAVEDEEEKARRLARAAAGGAPQVALAGPLPASVPTSPQGAGGDGGAPKVELAAANAAASGRVSVQGGAPEGGAKMLAAEPGAEAGRAGAETVSNVSIARAEAADGAPGAAALGGGTNLPARSAAGPTFAANTQAESPVLAGAPQSSGAKDGAPLEARGVEAARLAGGAAGASTPLSVAAPGEAVVDSSTPGLAGMGGKRQVSPAQDAGPAVGGATNVGAPLQRDVVASAPGATGAKIEIAELGASSAVSQAQEDHLAGMGKSSTAKQSGDALAVNIQAPDGPGGLGGEYTPEVGVSSRQAKRDSLDVKPLGPRFVRKTSGGLPAFSTTAVVTSDPFMNRSARRKGTQPGGGGKGASTPETEKAIEQGLEFLARYQTPAGHWSLQGFDDTIGRLSDADRRYMLVSDTGATGLALLCFLGADYNHREDQYKDVVRRGLDQLIRNQRENGDLFVPLDDRSNQSVWLYSHAIASLALCEAYAMTGDPALKEPAQKAINFIVTAQNKELGGWRYAPGVGADTSVTGWMVMALQTAQLSGLTVPAETFQGVDHWLDQAQGSADEARKMAEAPVMRDPSLNPATVRQARDWLAAAPQTGMEPHRYRYNPLASPTLQLVHGRIPSKTMSSVGLLLRYYRGWKRDNPSMQRGAEVLLQNLPAVGGLNDHQRDTYYWYYSTQFMYYMGGNYRAQWLAKLHPLLRESQEKNGAWAGSWDPFYPVPDEWGRHAGRLYITTMNILSLEVAHRSLTIHEFTKE